MYKLIRKVLFLLPPEDIHYFSMNVFSAVKYIPGFRNIISPAATRDPLLQKNIFNLSFLNPVGLAAGFDKNARYLSELEMLGFGSIEIGTVTPKPQAGNDKPRLFRIPEHCAIINRMVFNNLVGKAFASVFHSGEPQTEKRSSSSAETSARIRSHRTMKRGRTMKSASVNCSTM